MENSLIDIWWGVCVREEAGKPLRGHFDTLVKNEITLEQVMAGSSWVWSEW